jgi:hypothetical protein
MGVKLEGVACPLTMVLGLSVFVEGLLEAGAIAGSASAIAMAVTLVIGGIAEQAGKDVDPWKLATERGAPLGACVGVVIALVELMHWN